MLSGKEETRSAEQRLAIERGELDGDCGARSSLPADWLGAARSMRRSASRPDRSLACRPACRLRATLRRQQETKDQFLAEAEKLNLPLVDPVSGPDAEKIIASLYAAPPALVARTQAMVAQ
jgi:hypothetical protein